MKWFMKWLLIFTKSPPVDLQRALASSHDFLFRKSLTHVSESLLSIHPEGHKPNKRRLKNVQLSWCVCVWREIFLKAKLFNSKRDFDKKIR